MGYTLVELSLVVSMVSRARGRTTGDNAGCNASRSHTHAISSLLSSFGTNDLVSVRTQNIGDSA